MSAALLALLLTADGGQVRLSARGPVTLGAWNTFPSGMILEAFEALPGESYEIDVRSRDPKSTLRLSLMTGILPTDDHDIDDAKEVVALDKTASRKVSAVTKVRPGGNAVWFRILPQSEPQYPVEVRILHKG